ncbi:3-hydroxyisobutyryl-CoA hydrolase [Ascobolus immersus RN42]|uniref:3-hydroxyisobutyryl-CoA hydrolase n=1 Tax=Ascobolus immersus RN42 TaxID=1160509 RepID=A0A3N4I9A1_ASCIM|nr:3-hydroxyisobutyryl-CoA hydrolase [Ascobolus immersus RN42]
MSFLRSTTSRLAQQSLRFSITKPSVASMPLRAKITSNAFSTSSPKMEVALDSLPGDDPYDVKFNSNLGLRTIELNRPKKLNALDGSMARKILPRMQEWAKSDLANLVLIKGAGGKAFCAGGDVAALVKFIKENPGGEGIEKAKEYFALEYKLDHLIATYSKPYVAIIDGITMGGGVGLSVHAPFRVATEKTLFAMPETDIGFFPDVGGSFFLSRLDGEVGTYLALTSDRLKGVANLYAGIATHYVNSSALGDLENRLSELKFDSVRNLEDKYRIINNTINEYQDTLPTDQFIPIVGLRRMAIDRCFRFNTVEEIKQALIAETQLSESEGGQPEWAKKTLETLSQRCPTSLIVSLRALREGKKWNISETFQWEYIIASHFMAHPDFAEGVSAKLIDKPARTAEYTPVDLQTATEKDISQPFFQLPKGTKILDLVGVNDKRTAYRHDWIGLPAERKVQQFVESKRVTRDEVLREFVEREEGRFGVKQKVTDILLRKTVVDEEGIVSWAKTQEVSQQ